MEKQSTELVQETLSELRVFKEAVMASSIISITDREGFIKVANKNFEAISGFSLEELVGKKHTIVNSGFHTREFWVNMWKSVTRGNIWRAEVKNKKKDGSYYWVDNLIIPLRNEEGQITEYLSIRHDITEKKNNEEKFKLALQRAEEADHLKKVLLANLSHELRTPMNAILGLTELLDKPRIEEQARVEYSGIIHRASILLLNTINDIVDISRLETNQMSLTPKAGNLNEFLEEQLRRVASHEMLSDKEIIVTIANELIGEENLILADFPKLQQVFDKILKNASKFTARGKIEIDCRLYNPNELLFSVKDTGIGMETRKLEMIFEPFRQASDLIHQQYGGSGLGLAIAKSLVQLWGGKIWADSEPGKGSTFYFTIPYQKIKD